MLRIENLWRIRRNELLVGQELLAQLHQALGQGRLGRGESGLGVRGRRVDDRAGGQHEGQGAHRVVPVALQRAAHTAGVVRDDAADRRRVDARRIRP